MNNTLKAEQLMTSEALGTLVELDFPTEFHADDAGVLEVPPEDRVKLAAFFEAFGLRLPLNAHAETAGGLWRELRLGYGQAVRLSSKGRAEDVHTLCREKLSLEQRTYGIAVGLQDLPLAQFLARRIFTGEHRANFCCP